MNSFSSKHLIFFTICSLLFALGLSLYISERQGKFFSNDFRNREISLLFGAIEAGPLAIARLNSSAFSQEAIDRLMQNPSLQGRAIVSASIFGGENGNYQYAKWLSNKNTSKECLESVQKKYHYPDSLNSFIVLINYDKCSLLIEEKQIYKISLFSTSLVFILVCIAIFLAILPIVISLKIAFAFLRTPQASSDLNQIKFLPLRYMTELALKSFNLEKEAVKVRLSEQVAHDIRSPLAALTMAIQDLSNIPHNYQSVIQNSIDRINNIANNLLHNKNMPYVTTSRIEPEVLFPILENLISEKKIQYRNLVNISFDFNFYSDRSLVVNINKTEFQSTISNLINNAVEAKKLDNILITLTITTLDEKTVKIRLQDNGKGIPKDFLEKIGTRGFSHDKNPSSLNSGSGLGLYHAKNTITSLGGELNIYSNEGIGTEIEIILPVIIPLPSHDTIFDYVYIEDDELLRFTWEARAKKQNIKLLTLNSIDEFRLHQAYLSKEHTSIYIDSNLGNKVRGEEFAIILNSQGYQKIFISSGYDATAFSHIPWLIIKPKKCPF